MHVPAKDGAKNDSFKMKSLVIPAVIITLIFLNLPAAIYEAQARQTGEEVITPDDDVDVYQGRTIFGIRIGADIESGVFWFSRNDVRIPGGGGTEFDMLDLIGTDPSPHVRINLNLGFGERHTLRLLFAPLKKRDTGTLAEDTFFEETEFTGGQPTEGMYQFNTWRATYRYTFYRDDFWTLGAGAAVLIRDAEVRLRQGELTDSNTDLGFVPLLHFYSRFFITPDWSLIFDAEGLASTQGRAIDAALTLDYEPSDRWSVFAGYRLLDGGADNDEVYNFAWINYAMGGLRFTL